jgi:hypothetical protein
MKREISISRVRRPSDDPYRTLSGGAREISIGRTPASAAPPKRGALVAIRAAEQLESVSPLSSSALQTRRISLHRHRAPSSSSRSSSAGGQLAGRSLCPAPLPRARAELHTTADSIGNRAKTIHYLGRSLRSMFTRSHTNGIRGQARMPRRPLLARLQQAGRPASSAPPVQPSPGHQSPGRPGRAAEILSCEPAGRQIK